MALNASGAISLGGATAGQSVNLELGNAATAEASINSTPFRTLAAIPSGTIALSNFYSKSSNSYWALMANRTVLDRGYAASVNGVLAVGPGESQNSTYADTMYFFDVDGGFTKSTNCNSYYSTNYNPENPSPKQGYVNSWVNNNSTSAPIFYQINSQNFYPPYGFNAFDHTTNTNKFSSNKSLFGTATGYWYGYDIKGVLVDASSNVYVVPRNPTLYAGKFTAIQTAYSSWTSSGTERYGYKTSSVNYAPAAFQGCNVGVLRSDNILVVAGLSSSSTIGIYTVNTSTGSQVSAYTYNRTTNGRPDGSFLCDSSNNLYLVCTNDGGNPTPVIYKIGSNYTTTSSKTYGADSSSSAQAGWYVTGSMYNDELFVVCTGATANALVVFKVNTSTLEPVWTTKIAFSGTLNNEYANSSGQQTIIATSVGLYVRTIVNGFFCTLKIPLDGNISGTKTITHPNASTSTITFNYYTSGSNMATASSNTFTYNTTLSVPMVSHASSSNSGTTPTSGNTPSTSKSTL